MEKYELVDKEGKSTGKILTEKQLCNIPEGYYLPVVGVVIINDKKEVLLQKRSKLKRVNPNKWGICGGKINYGESPKEAAIRETKEEIGISLDVDKLNLIGINFGYQACFITYYIEQNIDVSKCVLQKEEVEQVQYFKVDEVEKLDNEGIEWIEDLRHIFKYKI